VSRLANPFAAQLALTEPGTIAVTIALNQRRLPTGLQVSSEEIGCIGGVAI